MTTNYHFKGEALAKKNHLSKGEKKWYSIWWSTTITKTRSLLEGATGKVKEKLERELEEDLLFCKKQGISLR